MERRAERPVNQNCWAPNLEGEEGPCHHLAVVWFAASVEEYGLVTIHILVLVPGTAQLLLFTLYYHTVTAILYSE